MALWGTTDNDASKPKYLSDELRNDQEVSDLDLTVGVSVTEAQVAANREKGVKTPGWTKYVEYTDAQGSLRHKAEILVAFGGGISGDASDDTVAEDPSVTIEFDSANVYIVSPDTVTLEPTVTTNGAFPVTYQWYDAADDSAIEGATGTTLTLEDITAPQAYYLVASYNGTTTESSTVNVLED